MSKEKITADEILTVLLIDFRNHIEKTAREKGIPNPLDRAFEEGFKKGMEEASKEET
ncbi:MAG: hypothetical protein JXA82_17875 [Sedimentisphaerales bacterium]|nr:hypothetical protein [Sedimentisphaerales bacterium]